MKLSKQQLKTSTRHYIKKCAGAVCTSKLHESARNSQAQNDYILFLLQNAHFPGFSFVHVLAGDFWPLACGVH